MTASVIEPEVESSLADLRDMPLGDAAGHALTTSIEGLIMPQTQVSAFNSSI